MNIIITMAGHSRRFHESGIKEPKFLIDIDGAPMIEHVVRMFDPFDDFHFVINEDQAAEYPELPALLKSLARKTHLTIIKSHEQGPVWSAMQVQGIEPNAEAIITYCDFDVEWDYKNFRQQIYGFDAAIPAFKGFHPASFGTTFFAYMRVNERQELLELREKESFTDKRHEEYASTGAYYFRRWDMFMHYARQLMQSDFGKLKEGYVTLLFNQMVEEGLRVRVVPVERFICWGTPEDLEQYRFWSRYFQVLPASPVKPQNNREQINLIPLAGKGGRFRDYGYRVGKPLIMVRGAPMALSSCKSFPAADKWVFLARGEDLARHPLEKALRSFAPESEVIPVDHDTSGQAATCLLAKSHLSDEASLLITSCDYETLYNAAAWQKLISDESIDAVVWTYRMKSALAKNFQAFAYCQTDKGGTQVSRIVEKKTISETPWLDPLVVGTFWFRRAADFVWCAENAIARNITVNNEHYVGTSMNLLIEQGKKIVIFDIEQWVSFGDPFELNVLNYWEDYFAVKNVSQNYSRPAAAGE